jgi:hypothetical protein
MHLSPVGNPGQRKASNKKSGNPFSFHFDHACARLRLSPAFRLHQSPPIVVWFPFRPGQPNLIINLAGITTLK